MPRAEPPKAINSLLEKLRFLQNLQNKKRSYQNSNSFSKNGWGEEDSSTGMPRAEPPKAKKQPPGKTPLPSKSSKRKKELPKQ